MRKWIELAERVEVDDDPLFEMANLDADETGIQGIVFISTAMGQHGPRVKYFERTGSGQPSMSVVIAERPRIVASSLPKRVTDRVGPKVIEWVSKNRDALLLFWTDGNHWTNKQVQEFISNLKKVD